MSTPKRERSSTRHGRKILQAWRWLCVLAAGVVVLASLGYGALRESADPRFAPRIGVITGLDHTARGQVIRAAALPVNHNVWLMNRTAASRRIERLPWVQSARLSVRWPNVVRIDIIERTPAAYVVLAAQDGEEPLPRYALIDGSQRVLLLADQRSQTGGYPLLLVTPPPSAEIAPGGNLSNREVAEALQALSRLRSLGLQISQVAIAPALGISATADRNLRVLFGESEDLAKKAAVFQAIVAKISEPARIAYIDVRSVHAPTVLYR